MTADGWLQAVSILFIVALVVRVAAAAVCGGLGARIVRALLCAGSAWLMAGIVGAWVPIWIPIGAAAAAAVVARWIAGSALMSGLECSVVVLCCVASIPAVPLAITLIAAAAVAGAGALIDLGVRAFAFRLTASGACAVAAIVGITISAPKMGDPAVRWHLLWSLPSVGVLTERPATRLSNTDPSGAWMEYPRGSGPFPAAILFHGARRAGARDAAAALLRRSLLDAGFAVCSLDHPGFGSALPPAAGAPQSAWDPLPYAVTAVRRMRADPRLGDLIAVGHSMGGNDALRLAAADPTIRAAVLLGAGPNDTDSSDQDADRFNRDRGLSPPLPEAEVRAIVEQFYDTTRIATSLSPTHPLVVMVEMEDDYPGLIAGGRRLFDVIGGARSRWRLRGSAHDFNAYKSAVGVVIGDTRIARQLSERLRELPAAWMRPS